MMLNGEFRGIERALSLALLNAKPIARGSWHSQVAPAPTRELRHVRLIIPVPPHMQALQSSIPASLPWAEDQFRERVSGQPLNPPPSHEWWPYAEKGNTRHLESGAFSHSYPERYYPRFANVGAIRGNGRQVYVPHNGIRFEYGDLDDLIDILRTDPTTRQAVLPVWFPEDLCAANQGYRVPCSLFYHFLLDDEDKLDVEYSIRSCDYVRHFRDDVYMTMRLLQHVVQRTFPADARIRVGQLVMTIGSLHCFPPDEERIQREFLHSPS